MEIWKKSGGKTDKIAPVSLSTSFTPKRDISSVANGNPGEIRSW